MSTPYHQGSGRDPRSRRDSKPASSSQFALTPRFIFSSSLPQRHTDLQGSPKLESPLVTAGNQPLLDGRRLRPDDIDEEGDHGRSSVAVRQKDVKNERQESEATHILEGIENSEGYEDPSVSDADMIVDSIEHSMAPATQDANAGLRISRKENSSYMNQRYKRRHPSSSPPEHLALRDGAPVVDRRSTKRQSAGQPEPIVLSSSPSPQEPQHDGDDTDSEGGDEIMPGKASSDESEELMSPIWRPSKWQMLPPDTKGHKKLSSPMVSRVRSPVLRQSDPVDQQRTTAAVSHHRSARTPSSPAMPPRTPTSKPTALRFQFTTPQTGGVQSQSHNVHQLHQFSQTPLGLSNSTQASASTPASRQFLVPNNTAAESELGDALAPIASLPDLFSPQKHGSARFVPGGLAEGMRNAILQAGGAMHVARTRKVRVLEARPAGDNGALLALIEEMPGEPYNEGNDAVNSSNRDDVRTSIGKERGNAAPDNGGGPHDSRENTTLKSTNLMRGHSSSKYSNVGVALREDEPDAQSGNHRLAIHNITAASECQDPGTRANDIEEQIQRGQQPHSHPPHRRHHHHQHQQQQKHHGRSMILMVGVDDGISRHVRPGDVVGVRHGWQLNLSNGIAIGDEGGTGWPLDQARLASSKDIEGPGTAQKSRDGDDPSHRGGGGGGVFRAQDSVGTRRKDQGTGLEVCWGPIG